MENNVRKTPTDERSTALEQTNVESVSQQLRNVGTTPASLSEVAGLLISSSFSVINNNLPQTFHFYRYDVVEGETYTVENKSTTAALEVYICDASDGSDKTICVSISPRHTDNFVASRNALYIGFYNNANAVDITFSHIGFDQEICKILPINGIVLSSEKDINEPSLVQYNHFYRYDVVKGQCYTINNLSTQASLIIYTSNTGDTSYSSAKTEYGTIAPNGFLTFCATENARYIGFFNNANSVHVIISHVGLDSLQTGMTSLTTTIGGFDQRISSSKSEAVAEANSYTDSAILGVTPTNILWNQLSASLQNRIDGAGGTITNLPDGEDLTTENSMLRFADKNATLMQFGGKSRKFLRKNVVNGQNILTPSMVSAANTVYLLQYDYSLDNQTVTLGNGSTIIFYGGSVSNGTVDYSNGSIIPASYGFFKNNLSVVTNEPVNLAWYGKKSGDNIDDVIDLLQGHTIIIPVGDFKCTKSGYVLEPGTMFIGEKVLNNDQTCCISFHPANETKDFIIGLNNNCGFKDITLLLQSTTYNGDLVRVDSAFWKNSYDNEYYLQALRAQQYYIDNVYFLTKYMAGDNYLATAFHIIVRDKVGQDLLPINMYKLSYRQHFKNVEIKYFSTGICVELIEEEPHAVAAGDWGVWCNSLHFFDIDMWVRNNGFVLKTRGLTNWAQGRFVISGILIQPVGVPDSHFPYAFYAENGYKCMLDKINAWDNSKVAYVGGGSILLGQYMADLPDPLDVRGEGVIKTPTWTDNSVTGNNTNS